MQARPMPLAPPVTRAWRPLKWKEASADFAVAMVRADPGGSVRARMAASERAAVVAISCWVGSEERAI